MSPIQQNVSPGQSPQVLSFDIHVERSGFALNAAASFGQGITAVFGPSGAGKSTLLGAVAGSVRPIRGSISLFGRDLYSSESGINLKPEQRRVGIVYQDSALFPHMTVEKNIFYGHRLTPQEQRRLDPLELAELLGISHLLQRRPDALSGGEKQRVALARTLATSPQLLLLDEPMSALDVRLRGIVLGYLKVVHRELSMPIVYVSHSLSEVMAIADEALILGHGEVIGFGGVRNLLATPLAGFDEGNDADLALDNLLEGQVIEAHSDGSQGRVRIGTVDLVAPTAQRHFGEKVVISIGSREIILASERPVGISARNVIEGKVVAIDGDSQRRLVTVDCGTEIMAEVTASAIEELHIEPGKSVFLVIKSSSIAVMDAFSRSPEVSESLAKSAP